MIGNSIAGSEKVGLITKGVPCDDMTAQNRIRDNEVIFVYFEVPNNRLRGLSKGGGNHVNSDWFYKKYLILFYQNISN